MRFDVPCARDYLLKHGRLYTLRTYRMKRPITFRFGLNGRMYARGYIDGPVGKEDLECYVSESGFDSIDDWWHAAQVFAKGAPLHLYLVKSVEEE